MIMGKEDILKCLEFHNKCKVIAVHMDAINHCMHSRAMVREFIKEKKIEDKPLNVEKKNLIDLNFDSLDVNGKEFVNKWNIEIEKGFDDSIMLEQSTQITIRITNKVS